MKDIILLLPNNLQSWLGLGVIGVITVQLTNFMLMLLFGNPMALLEVVDSSFTSASTLGKLSAQLVIGFCGGVLIYWWEIGRKKQ